MTEVKTLRQEVKNILVTPEAKKRLDELKIVAEEPYYKVINRLLFGQKKEVTS